MATEVHQMHQLDLFQLEAIIERGIHTFIEVGEALLEIRDRRLYRKQGFDTFENYCQKRWGWGRNYVNKQIAAAEVIQNLGTTVPIPETERQVRPLAQLPPAQQREAWTQAVEQSPNGQPTAQQVATVVKKDFLHVIAEKIEARRKATEPSKPMKSEAEKEQLRQLREDMKKNSQRATDIMTVIRAIEALSQPPIEMKDAAHEMARLDTPDKDWCGQARIAESNLRKLTRELP